MLILARMQHEHGNKEWIEISIGGEIVCVGVVQVRGNRVRIGVDASRSVKIERVRTRTGLPSENRQAVIREVTESEHSKQKRLAARVA